MLPVATAPNAIVYSASSMSTRDMASMGFAMNIICVFMTTIAINTYGVLMFDLNTFPEWATEIIPSNLNLTCSTNNLTIT
jgi:sodium-dependent dicarboxylate transporter 2/3/5